MRTIALLLLAFATTAYAQEPPATPTIVTSGEATIRRSPDVAFVSVAIETRAKTPREAQRLNADATASVVQRLTSSGISKDALRTIGLSLNQEYDFANGRRTPRDFAARNAIEVRVADVARAGEIADAAVQAGATAIDGIRFDLNDRAAAEHEALKQAVVDARGRAEAVASGAGRSVGAVLKIEESREGPIGPRPMVAFARAKDEATTPIEPGLIEVRAHVTLTVSLK